MKYLKALEDIGILPSVKIGRERIYVNVRLFDLLKFSDVCESLTGTHKNHPYLAVNIETLTNTAV